MASVTTIEESGVDPVIEVVGLRSSFGDHIVHDHLDLTVPRGEIFAVVGGSGAGKSVLLDILMGLKAPDAGSVKLFGEALRCVTERQILEIDRRLGVLFQGGALFSNLDVLSNIAAPLVEHGGYDRAAIRALADLKLALVGLGPEVGSLKPSELSGGMLKRVGLARSLSLDPELLLLDEPTAGLDPLSASAFDRLICELSRSLGFTVVLITHDLDTLYAITDRVAVLADRKVVACAPVHTLEQSDHPWIQEYFHGPRGRAAAASASRRGD